MGAVSTAHRPAGVTWAGVDRGTCGGRPQPAVYKRAVSIKCKGLVLMGIPLPPPGSWRLVGAGLSAGRRAHPGMKVFS